MPNSCASSEEGREGRGQTHHTYTHTHTHTHTYTHMATSGWQQIVRSRNVPSLLPLPHFQGGGGSFLCEEGRVLVLS